MFSLNGYPRIFLDKVLTKFRETLLTGPVAVLEDAPTYFYTITLPYLGKPTIDFKKEIVKLFKSKFSVDINVAVNSCKVGNFVSLKAKTPSILTANVVYKFTCSGDEATSYIGKTERHFAVRMDEHLDPKKKSAVTDHIRDCQICQSKASYSNFKIIKKCDSPYSTSIHEAFLIREFKPTLNAQTPNQGQCVLLKIF